MRFRGVVIGILATLVLSASAALAQESGVAIDHKEVGCLVVGKYPKMNACFAPASNVARARVYFRPEGAASWYYVDMKSDAPCHAGILPRPTKALLEKRVDYYVHVTDRNFVEGRTLEYNPRVVNSEQECKDKPAAAYLSKAAVKVFPGLPGGFAAGGLGTATAVGVGAGVAGAAAGGVAIASSGDGGGTTTTTTTRPSAPTTTQPPATTTTTSTTSTTQPAGQFRFVLHVDPSPPRGTEPLDVEFDMCLSTPKDDLKYSYDFDGDGRFDQVGGSCKQTRRYTVAGFSGRGTIGCCLPTTTTTAPREPITVRYNARACAEPRGNAEQRQCDGATVVVTENLRSSSRRVSVVRAPSRRAPATRRLAWNSELSVPDGAGQVVANGATAVFAGRGRSSAVAVGRRGENRIEAQLVQANGPGTWRFELGATASFQPGSLRVIAGDVALVTGDTVVFRLTGKPGERVVFTFRTTR